MRGRPTPEDPGAQEAELEEVADIRADAVRGMDTAGNHFISGSDQRANEFGLPNSPACQRGLGASADAADGKQDDRQGNRHEPADRGGGKHPGTKDRIAGGGEIEPVQTGRDEDESEDDGNDVPNDHPAPEAVEEVTGQGRKKLFHADRKSTRLNSSHANISYAV